MSLRENHKKFLSGELAKADLIKNNFERTFSALFDVSEFLKETEITKVELVNGDVIMTYKSGMKLACEKDEYRTAPLETLNFLRYEEAEVSVFNQLIKDKKCFYDIGGNIGFYALHASMINPDIKIKTFEPVPKMFATLTKNVALNQMGQRIETHNFGFSDTEGTVSFFIYPFGGTNASMVNVSSNIHAQEVKAKVLRLDDFVGRGSNPPDIIKCDVEGAEKLVLMGGLETIKKYKPIVFFELLRKWSAKFNYHPNEVLKTLKDMGYHCYVPHEGKLKAFDLVDDNTSQTNFFFLHPDKHEA